MTDYELDDLDRAILRELEIDGRRALREIARNVGSSEATIRARVKRLQDENILRIVAFADPEQLGQSQLGLALLTVEPSQHDSVIEALSGMLEVTYVSTVMGRSDICVEILCRDNSDLWEILNTKVRALPGVRDTESMAILKVHKLRYLSPATG